jgi:hypothetical protein
MELTAPHEAAVVTDFLTFHISAARVDAEGLQTGIAGAFGPPADERRGHKEDRHGAPHGPAVLLVPDLPPEVIGEAARDEEDRKHLNEIREGSWVLVGMGGVGVEKAAAVGPQHFDGDLGGGRTLGDHLGIPGLGRGCRRRAFDGSRPDVGFEVLDDPLGS